MSTTVTICDACNVPAVPGRYLCAEHIVESDVVCAMGAWLYGDWFGSWRDAEDEPPDLPCVHVTRFDFSRAAL